MPPIYSYQCKYKELRDFNGVLIKNDCDFSVEDPGPQMLLQTKAGKIVLHHPLEDTEAQEATGQTIDQMNKMGKITFKSTKFCLNCLQVESNCQCVTPQLIELSELENYKCPKCHRYGIVKKQIGMS